jgi:molecular chaperone GrpE
LSEHEGKTIPINTSRQDREKSADRKTAVQSHPRTEPVSVGPPKGPATAQNESEVDPLEKLRSAVHENRGHLKSAEFVDAAMGEIAHGQTWNRATALEALTLLVLAEKESWENRDRWMRSVADLENYKKRALHDKSRLLTYQHEELLRDLLPVLDSLERALGHSENTSVPSAFIEGMEMIAQMLRGVCEKYGVTPVKTVGEPFDPAIHEALSRMPAPGMKPNLVVKELEKGYLYKDRLLRPAKVVISG